MNKSLLPIQRTMRKKLVLDLYQLGLTCREIALQLGQHNLPTSFQTVSRIIKFALESGLPVKASSLRRNDQNYPECRMAPNETEMVYWLTHQVPNAMAHPFQVIKRISFYTEHSNLITGLFLLRKTAPQICNILNTCGCNISVRSLSRHKEAIFECANKEKANLIAILFAKQEYELSLSS